MDSTHDPVAGTTSVRMEAPPMPPAAQLQQMVMGKMVTQMIGAAARFDIADLLSNRPRPVGELASASKTDEQSLYRLLRGLASVGIFAETEPGTFANTPMSEALRGDAPDSVRDFAIFFSHDLHNRIWSELPYSVSTGQSAADNVFGMKDFAWLADHPDFAETFHRAMTSLSRGSAFPVTQAYDFSGFERIVDVGGGHGFLLATILNASTGSRGVLFDLPEVVDGAGETLNSMGVSDRCEVIGGDFFEGVPEEGDCYIMKMIIHDWSDEASETILRNCASAMKQGGKVMVVEMVIPPGNEPHPGKLIDIEMLAIAPGGRERSADEFRALFERSGLRLTRIVPTMSPMSILEGVRA